MSSVLKRSFGKTAVLNKSTVNPNLIKTEYAVRGYIPTLAAQIKSKIAAQPNSYPFDSVVQMNIGNPLIFNTRPITTTRYVLGKALSRASGLDIMPAEDSRYYIEKNFQETPPHLWQELNDLADELSPLVSLDQRNWKGGYSGIKKDIAEALIARDALPAEPEQIFLSNGASAAIRLILHYLVKGSTDGVLIPIPQYPLYSALIDLLGGSPVPYYLQEEKEWAPCIDDVSARYEVAVKSGVHPRALVLINPGNPTGSVMSRSVLEELLAFAHSKGMVVLADEVYQENIYGTQRWLSCRKVLGEMPANISKELELISFHSLSKGLFGECGIRGGYMELTNIDASFLKGLSTFYANVPPGLISQLLLSLKARLMSGNLRDKLSTSSFSVLEQEISKTQESLFYRAGLAVTKLNSLPGVSCNPIEGAMYAFPSLKLSPKFQETAAAIGMPADTLYCKELLERGGICVVPGNGFGQKEGTFHFRATILPSPDKHFTEVFDRFATTHLQIMEDLQ